MEESGSGRKQCAGFITAADVIADVTADDCIACSAGGGTGCR